MRFTSRLVFLLCVFISYGLANQCSAQSSIGIRWDVPEERSNALAQLDTLEALGISLLEINSKVDPEIWNAIDSLGFRIYGQIPISFPLTSTFSNPDSILINTISDYTDHYSSKNSIEAIGLFQYGAVNKAAFDTTLQPYLEEIQRVYNGSLYYTTARSEPVPLDKLINFKLLGKEIHNTLGFTLPDSLPYNVAGYIYLPGNSMNRYLKPFKNFLERISTKSENINVFVNSEWLFKMLNKYPDFANTLKLINTDSELIFPVPHEEVEESDNYSLMVLLIVFIWGLFAINYHLSPVYRKSLSRYFTSHLFFVEDVMNRHIRSMGPSIVVLFQNMLLAGICTYSLAVTLFSTLGLEAIQHHYPLLAVFGNPSLAIFLIGCFFGLLLTVISIIWLRISNKRISQTRQVLNLYAWPLQINFFIVTVMTALLATGTRPVLMISLAILFAIVHISAFIIAALDIIKYLNKQKILFFALSIGLYIILWSGSGIWLLKSKIPDVIQLALSLS